MRGCCQDQLPPGLTHVVTPVAAAIKDARAGGGESLPEHAAIRAH